MNNKEKEEILKSTEKLWNERNRLKQLEKENADLKVQIELYSEKVRYWEEQSKLKESQLEEQDRQAFFTAAKFDELKAQIEKMKNCENCKYNCKEDGEEYCDSPNGVCKRYSTTFDKDNWELAE